MTHNPQPSNMQPPHHHMMGSNLGPPRNQLPPMSTQFRPVIPPPAPVPPYPPQQYQHVGHPNVGMQMPPPPPMQYHPVMQPPFQQPSSLQPPPPLQHPMQPPPQAPPSGFVQSQGLAVPHPDIQPRPVMPGSLPPPAYNPMMPNSGGPRFSHVPYNIAPSSEGPQQVVTAPASTQAESTNIPAGQPWYPAASHQMQLVLPSHQALEQQKSEERALGGTPSTTPNNSSLPSVDQNAGPQHLSNGNHSDLSCTHSQSTAEQSADAVKDIPTDAAKKDASGWREYTSPQGKKYYYNKKTKISLWEKPLELMTPIERADSATDWREFTAPDGRRFFFNKVIRKSTWVIPDEVKLARKQANLALTEGTNVDPASADVHVSVKEASDADGNNISSSERETVSNLAPVSTADLERAAVPKSSSVLEEAPSQTVGSSCERISEKSLRESSKDAGTLDRGDNSTPAYEIKEDAKIAFRALLDASNIGSDWTWDQAMRVIINDRRYGALRSLGERKQAFNEFLEQKKTKEVEDKRARQRKSKEDFKMMLQECKDLTSSTRWSKAVSMLERDARFLAVERSKDREDLFEAHLEELKKKEWANNLEEHKRHVTEYLDYLKSCDFIKASSQWRKVQYRLEADERCSRLEKIERLEIFQEYVRGLEMEEEEQRKLRMEEMRRAERKNRDEFRKLLEEHAAVGLLTVNSHWREYAMKVKETPAYMAISANTSGATAKDLFEDVLEDLEKQYLEDKERLEEAIMNQKICLTPSWTFEEFKTALSGESCIRWIPDSSVKLIFNDLLEIKKEREEKEARRRKRRADDVFEFLYSLSELTSSSKWEDFRAAVEERFVGEESFFRDIFDRVVEKLKEKERHKERKRREERKHERKGKDRGRRSTDRYRYDKERRRDDGTDSEASYSSSFEEKRKRSRDKSRKYERYDYDSTGEMSPDDDERDHYRSHRHTTKSKQMETDSESENKRHKRDHWNPSMEDLQNMDGIEEGEVQ